MTAHVSLPRALVPTTQARAETQSWEGLYLEQTAGSGRHRRLSCLLITFLKEEGVYFGSDFDDVVHYDRDGMAAVLRGTRSISSRQEAERDVSFICSPGPQRMGGATRV